MSYTAARTSKVEPGVYLTYSFHIRPWNEGLDGCDELLRRGFENAERIGDLTFAVYILNGVDSLTLFRGAPLDETKRACERALDYGRKVPYDFVGALVQAKLQLVRMLHGDLPGLGSLTGNDFDEAQFARDHGSVPVMTLPMSWYAKQPRQGDRPRRHPRGAGRSMRWWGKWWDRPEMKKAGQRRLL